MIQITKTAIAGVVTIDPVRHGDARGYFSETFNQRTLAASGIALSVVQENHSFSAVAGTVRGLHFQTPPYAQAKHVRVVRGRILDVVVDVRRSSPTFGRHVAIELSGETGRQMFVPHGCAHGFMTLTSDCDVIYLVDQHHVPSHDLGIAFDDPALAIRWPDPPGVQVMSDRDKRHPRLADCRDMFP